MDYLLTCSQPSDVCYVRYLQAYANGCHILNLPFVESIAKVDFECMLRKRFFDKLTDEDEDAILNVVTEAAYIPLMPAWFFERKPVTQSSRERERYQLKKPHGTQIYIPAIPKSEKSAFTTSAAVNNSSSSSSSATASASTIANRRRSCSRTAFSASYNYSTSLTKDERQNNLIPKSFLLQIILRFKKSTMRN